MLIKYFIRYTWLNICWYKQWLSQSHDSVSKHLDRSDEGDDEPERPYEERTAIKNNFDRGIVVGARRVRRSNSEAADSVSSS